MARLAMELKQVLEGIKQIQATEKDSPKQNLYKFIVQNQTGMRERVITMECYHALGSCVSLLPTLG